MNSKGLLSARYDETFTNKSVKVYKTRTLHCVFNRNFIRIDMPTTHSLLLIWWSVDDRIEAEPTGDVGTHIHAAKMMCGACERNTDASESQWQSMIYENNRHCTCVDTYDDMDGVVEPYRVVNVLFREYIQISTIFFYFYAKNGVNT